MRLIALLAIVLLLGWAQTETIGTSPVTLDANNGPSISAGTPVSIQAAQTQLSPSTTSVSMI